MFNSQTFFEFVQPEYLYAAASLFIGVTIILVALIYLFLYQKKKKARVKERISLILDEWIGNAILSSEEEQHIYVTSDLLDYFEDAENRTYATSQLVNSKKNLLGAAAKNIIRIYEQLELQNDSIKKLQSNSWHVRTKGIYELYMMEQNQAEPLIRRFTNHKNEFVRMEAQTAVIRFLGFEGLSFLNKLSEPFTDWQQVKVLDQLTAIDFGGLPNLRSWLHSSNPDVILFALRLAEVFQQFQVHTDAEQILRSSKSEKIRHQAIRTLAAIAEPGTATILEVVYDSESDLNKELILRTLGKIGDKETVGFLHDRLKESDDSIKLLAARALWSLGHEGRLVVDSEAEKDEETYGAIRSHVKSEVLK